MGVTGLWKLIEPCGKPVPVETLEGKVLAVDISIWLHQVVKGFQDNKGAALNNAHLLGLFHRLCKLMYYRVKPVFVFDGCVPQLKKDTIARRQQLRSKLNSEADRIQALLLQSLAKENIVQKALGPNAELLLTSPNKKAGSNKASRKEDSLDEMFKLPDLPSCSKNNNNHSDDESTDQFFNEDCSNTSASNDDSSFDDSNPRLAYNSNIQAIDVKSREFLQLPADVRHEILVDIKETRKQSSWGRLHELPAKSGDFSSFQMKRLLKRRDVQVSLETAEQEMGGHALTYAELTNIFSEEGILETDIVEKGTKQITSDEHTRFLLVKDLKKKIANIKENEISKKKDRLEETHIVPNANPNENHEQFSTLKDADKFGKEFDADLELAIALSLEDDANRVYDEKDYDYDSDESVKLSKAQRQQLQNAAKGPASSYMIEYAGMNREEVASILEKTQTFADLNDTLNIERLIGDTCGKENVMRETQCNTSKEKEAINNESQYIHLCVTDDSDATDSDLEEVDVAVENVTQPDINNQLNKVAELKVEDPVKSAIEKLDLDEECVIDETPPCLADEEVKINSPKTLSVQIDLTKRLEPEDDLFADIFNDSSTTDRKLETNLGLFKDTSFQDDVKDSISVKNSANILEADKEHKETKLYILNEGFTKLKNLTAPENTKILSILDELNRQADEIKTIKLENIKLSNSIIEISDDEQALKVSNKTPVVIEVCESDDNKRPSTPPLQLMNSKNQSQILNSKSPNLKTPSKNHSITDFFNVNYIVKHTPEKCLDEENQTLPKVQSPFFVRKTPKSENKSGSNCSSPKKKSLKANKTLFDQETEPSTICNDTKLDSAFMPVNETISNKEDILNEAANLLKSQKTAEELNIMASSLAKERQELENERNRQDRMGVSITQRMSSDCQDLLRLFGIPFIVAPMEAEAQCAFLDIIQLTNGTITDDSDIWLFGGRTVYKNFFAQNKHVMEFRSEQIENNFNCDRNKLIQLACLVGSDYTTGIHGIGAVTALEILASFTPKKLTNKQEDSAITSIQSILVTLERFRDWWQSFKSTVSPPGSSARFALQKKLKNIEIHEGFPSIAVVEAYLTPKVDDNKEPFTWGYPDVESLKEFAKKTFGWTFNKTDEILMPVLKKINEKRTQQSIRNYFNVKNSLNLKKIRVSKRVQNAIENMAGHTDSDDTIKDSSKAKKARKTNITSGPKKKRTSSKALEAEVDLIVEATCNETPKGPVKTASKRINIPETKEIIPQREKDLIQMDTNKKIAAKIFKNTNKETKKRKV